MALSFGAQPIGGRRAMIRRLGLGTIAVGLLGCTNPLASDGQADVALFMVIGQNGGPVTSSVVTPTPDVVPVLVALRSKNIRFNTTQYTRAVMLTRYEITFYRSDGRNTEGVDVPYSIAGNIAGEVDLANSGGVTVPVEVVRAQAKIEPPLRNLRGPVGGQAQVFTCFADITIYGHQIASGDIVKTTGSMQIDFTGVVN